MTEISILRFQAIKSANVLPNVLSAIVDTYLRPVTEEDKMVELLECNKYRQKMSIRLNNGHSATILWGRNVQPAGPRDFKKKRYKMEVFLNPGRTSEIRRSVRSLPFSALLPNDPDTNGVSELARSFFYPNCADWVVAATDAHLITIPTYRRRLRRLLALPP